MYRVPTAGVEPGLALLFVLLFAVAAFAIAPGACCDGCWTKEDVGGGTPGGGFKCVWFSDWGWLCCWRLLLGFWEGF